LTSSGKHEKINERVEEEEMAKRYSPKLKFQVVMEVLSGDKSMAQVAKAYNIHPNTVRNWKKEFVEKGPELFGQEGMVKEYEQRIAELEQLVGKKEVEIALLKGFLGQTG
jgi:transposase-like protein